MPIYLYNGYRSFSEHIHYTEKITHSLHYYKEIFFEKKPFFVIRGVLSKIRKRSTLVVNKQTESELALSTLFTLNREYIFKPRVFKVVHYCPLRGSRK